MQLRQTATPNLRWNFTMGVANGVAFRVVDTLVHPSLVLIVFLAQLTDNPIILGLPGALWMGGFFLSQLWVSGRIQRMVYTLPVYRATSLVRGLLWLGLVVATAAMPDATLLLLVFIGFLVLYPLVWGVGGLSFLEVVARAIPPRLRGPFFSWRQTLGGIVALGSGALVSLVLAPEFVVGFPHNFMLIFAAAAVMTVIGVLPFHAVREPPGEPQPASKTGLRGRWRDIRQLWRDDVTYRRYIQVRVALLLAEGTSPLIIVFAQARFDLPLNAAAVFLLADTITNLIAVAASGWISARWGNRPLGMASALLGGLCLGLVVAAGALSLDTDAALVYFLLVFVLLAIYRGASVISLFALSLNLAPAEQRPLYVGFSNTVIGLASYLGAAQGVIVGLAGYEVLFALAAGLFGFGLWQLWRIDEPAPQAA